MHRIECDIRHRFQPLSIHRYLKPEGMNAFAFFFFEMLPQRPVAGVNHHPAVDTLPPLRGPAFDDIGIAVDIGRFQFFVVEPEFEFVEKLHPILWEKPVDMEVFSCLDSFFCDFGSQPIGIFLDDRNLFAIPAKPAYELLPAF